MPTDIFEVNTTDKEGYTVGTGFLDNIAMTEMAPFDKMTVVAANKTNGAMTDYTVTFYPTVPLQDGDIFTVSFPSQIEVPRNPSCLAEKCLKSLECSGETGRISMVLVQPCTEENAEVKFVLQGIRNPQSLIPSGTLQASWTNKQYREVAKFSGTIVIQNKDLAYLDPSVISLNQANQEFGKESLYTLVFRPHNPIPKSGWVKIIYPSSVKIADEGKFIQKC